MFTWIFGSILVPTWLHFGSPNPPKSSQKSIPRGINFLIDFYIDFLSIFARFWRPTWNHNGQIFLQNGGSVSKTTPFFVRSMLCLDVGAFLAPSCRRLASIFEGVGLDFKSFWCPFSLFDECLRIQIFNKIRYVQALFFWFWMGWWGHAKR